MVHPIACSRVYLRSILYLVVISRRFQKQYGNYMPITWACLGRLVNNFYFRLPYFTSIYMTHVKDYSLIRELANAGLIKFNPATLKLKRSITGKMFMNYTVLPVHKVFTYKGFIYEVKQFSFNHPYFLYQS